MASYPNMIMQAESSVSGRGQLGSIKPVTRLQSSDMVMVAKENVYLGSQVWSRRMLWEA
jgi:hypothetical protein